MNCPICLDIQERIHYTQQAIIYYKNHTQYNEDRINYLIFVGINHLGRRPYNEHLSVVQRLHQQYTDHLIQLEQIQTVHHHYHPYSPNNL